MTLPATGQLHRHSKLFGVRLPPKLEEHVRAEAERFSVSYSDVLRRMLTRALELEQEKANAR